MNYRQVTSLDEIRLGDVVRQYHCECLVGVLIDSKGRCSNCWDEVEDFLLICSEPAKDKKGQIWVSVCPVTAERRPQSLEQGRRLVRGRLPTERFCLNDLGIGEPIQQIDGSGDLDEKGKPIPRASGSSGDRLYLVV